MPILAAMAQGTIKSYDPISNTGLLRDDASGEDVPLAENALDGSIFIMLRQGQRVNYDVANANGTDVATALRIGQAGS